MSTIKIVQLYCDAFGCFEAYEPTYTEVTSLPDQRRAAIAAGWRRSGGKDWCPKHSAKKERQ